MYYKVNCIQIRSCFIADNDLKTSVWEDFLSFNVKQLTLSIVNVSYIVGDKVIIATVLKAKILEIKIAS